MTAMTDAGTRAYIDAAVASHVAPTISDRAEAGATAARIARKFGLDEMELEGQVLAAVYMTMSDEELAAKAASPVTRKYARAEIARRNA